MVEKLQPNCQVPRTDQKISLSIRQIVVMIQLTSEFIFSFSRSTIVLLRSDSEVKHVIIRGDGDPGHDGPLGSPVPAGAAREHEGLLVVLGVQGRGGEGAGRLVLVFPLWIFLDRTRSPLWPRRSASWPGAPVWRPGSVPGCGGGRDQQRRGKAGLQLHWRLL